MKNLVDEVEVALPYGTRLFMVIRHPERVPLRLCALEHELVDDVRLIRCSRCYFVR